MACRSYKLDYGDNLWQVDNTPLPATVKKRFALFKPTQLPCNCKPMAKGKISHQLFFNFKVVRDIVFNNPSGKDVDNDIVNGFATHHQVAQKYLPSKAHRNNIIT